MTMETSLPLVYSAGDVAGYEGKITPISVGFGEAAVAANNAIARIRGRKVQPVLDGPDQPGRQTPFEGAAVALARENPSWPRSTPSSASLRWVPHRERERTQRLDPGECPDCGYVGCFSPS